MREVRTKQFSIEGPDSLWKEAILEFGGLGPVRCPILPDDRGMKS